MTAQAGRLASQATYPTTEDEHVAGGTGIDVSYDEVPYPDLCHAPTHPGRIGAVARLLNVRSAPAERCRVLEIGCAGGGNLVPMAHGLPESTFVGLDLSTAQVDAARDFSRSLGLRNVEFHAVDVKDFPADVGTFDYVIAHGVYSWVPREARDAILTICRRNLSPTGVAYVSYNTLPGWHLILMVREMMLFHARDITDPRRRARAGRELIVRLQSMIPDSDRSAFASFLDVFAQTRVGRFEGNEDWQDAALLHDELSLINEPVYVHQFVEHLQDHGLQYLADATFPQARTHDLTEDAVAQLYEMGTDPVAYEQYLDHVLHQTFRRTLLCHEEVEIRRTPRAADVTDLYIASRARLLGNEDGTAEFAAEDGSTFLTEDPLTVAALSYLHETSPQPIHFPALLGEARRRTKTAEPEQTLRSRLSTDLLRAAIRSGELAELTTHAPNMVPVPSARPLASPVLRFQARRSRFVATARHEQVELTGLSLAVVPLLDGRRTHQDLLGELMAMVDDGRLRNSQHDVPRAEVEAMLSRTLETTLQWLGRTGVLSA